MLSDDDIRADAEAQAAAEDLDREAVSTRNPDKRWHQSRVNRILSNEWGRMAIVDTKPFKLRVILHRIFVERPQVTGIPAWPGGAACYRRSRYIL